MSDTLEKIVCCDKGNNNDMLTAMLANNGGLGNNPMQWLVWLYAMRWLGNDNQNGNNRFDALSNQITDNQNINSLTSTITNNAEAMREIASQTNTNIDFVRNALCNLNATASQIGAQMGWNAEKVINAAILGNKDIIQQMQTCCCNTQQNIIKMGYENQLANCQQTNALTATMNANQYGVLDRMRDIGNGIAQGFASTAYDTQRQTCDIINAGNANTQRIVDTLNTHWKEELGGKLQDAKFEVSQLKQNQYLASLIGNGGNGCGCGV